MAGIHLKAKLQAYSKAPFYGDYIRPPKEVLGEDYDPEIVYGIKEGKWVDISATASGDEETLDSLTAKVNRINENIKCEIDANRLVFTNGNGAKFYYTLPEARVDGVTLGKNDLNQLYVLDTPDGESIKIVDVISEKDPFKKDSERKISGKLRATALYTEDDEDGNAQYISGSVISSKLAQTEKDIIDLKNYIDGKGGFLTPSNFGNLAKLPEIEIDSKLSKYAKEQLNSSTILDQTRIKNLYDGRIWAYVSATNTWIDEGADTVVTANNEGIIGAVTGSTEKFKVSISTEGTMSVNDLSEEFEKVVYKEDVTADDTSADSFVKRTTDQTIRTEASVNDLDAVNQSQVNSWVDGNVGVGEDIIDSYFAEEIV